MNVSEMKSKTVVELRSALTGLLQEQFSLRMQKGMGQAADTNELRRVRRDIARVKTIMTEKSNISEKSDGSSAV